MRKFPILIGFDGTNAPCPSWIPWDVIARYEGQAKVNHDQTLERLAERGGLCPEEAYLVMTGRRWRGETFTPEFEKEACAFLDKVVRDHDELQAARDRYQAVLQEIKTYSEQLLGNEDGGHEQALQEFLISVNGKATAALEPSPEGEKG